MTAFKRLRNSLIREIKLTKKTYAGKLEDHSKAICGVLKEMTKKESCALVSAWEKNLQRHSTSSTGLSEMKCQYLSLESVPSNVPDRIKKLDLSHNSIQNLTKTLVSNLYNLEELDIHDNHLETIEPGSLDVLTQLQSFNIASNRLHRQYVCNKDIFDCLHSLKILNLANNNLDSDMVHCYLSNTSSLVHLDVSWNAITVLFSGIFDGVPHVSELNLSNNFIDEIEHGTFDLLQNLRVLNLAANALRCISNFDLPQLHVLNLSSNVLDFFLINSSIEHYHLRNIDLSHNHLIHFPVMLKFHTVRHVNLSGNNIAELIPSSEKTQHNLEALSWYEAMAEMYLPTTVENSASQLSHVTDLNLSNNKLTAFPWYFLAKLRKLQRLNLAENCLTDIRAKSSPNISDTLQRERSLDIALHSLTILELQSNSIQFIPHGLFNNLPEIQQIDLKSNNIKFCSDHNQKLATEHFCSNFSSAKQLQYLDLQNNNIKHLPPRVFHQSSLVYLDLSHNIGLHIVQGALEELEQSLQILLINGNSMVDSQTNLPRLKSLTSLSVSNNKLTVIPFAPKCSLVESLDIQNNSLDLLDEQTTFLLKNSLRHISVSGNPFNCCSLTWLDILLDAKIHIEDLKKTQCIFAGNLFMSNKEVNGALKACLSNSQKGKLTIPSSSAWRHDRVHQDGIMPP
ncbi:transforming growth factor beta activator LRRC32-like [Gastrophryne carolinensis]